MRKQITAMDTVRCRCGFGSRLCAKSHINKQRIGPNSGGDQRFAFFLAGRIFQPDVIAAFDAFFTGRLRVDPHCVIPHQLAKQWHVLRRTVGMNRHFSLDKIEFTVAFKRKIARARNTVARQERFQLFGIEFDFS